MTFTVTYRGPDGGLHEEVVEAANRAECFAQMKARGIVPMGVKEGGRIRQKDASDRKGRTFNGRSRQPRKPVFAFVASVVLVIVVAGGLWWWMRREEAQQFPEPEVPKRPSALAKEVKPADAPKPVAAPKPVVVEAPETNVVPKRVLSREERMKNLVETHMEKKIDFTPSSNRVFKTSLEQKLAALFTTRLGAPPPPMPMTVTPVTMLHIEEILNAPNPILEGDSPKAVEAKKAVAAMKQEMKEYLAKGGKPEEFLSYYYSELKEAHEIWKESHFKLIDAMKKDPALAPQVEQELNTFLESKGIRPVMMPPKLKERLGIE